MLVGFTGPQCSGKSTLLMKMLHSNLFRKCSFVKEVTRKVASYGYEINDNGDNTTQLFILNEHLHNHHMSGCVVLDRCIIDGVVYTEWLHKQGKVCKWVLDYAYSLHHMLISKLDIILYPDPEEIELVGDEHRSTDVNFRDDIISLYKQYFEHYPEVKEKTVVIRGSVDERFKQIQKQLKKYDKTRQLTDQ
jgi:thymidylate kinase